MKYTKHFNVRETPQAEKIPGSDQVPNSAGGFAWQVTDWQRLERFIKLGTEGGTYYIAEKALTVENAQATLRCIQADGPRVVRTVVDVSQSGKAYKNDPAIFVLAMAAGIGDAATKQEALAAIPHVCRTSTHLFHFVQAIEGFRGWGRSLRRAIGHWYTDRTVSNLAYQVVKYRQRDGWTHRDVLRLAHPKALGLANNVLRWVVKGEYMAGEVPDLIYAFDRAQKATDVKEIVQIIQAYELPREAIPTNFLNAPEVWEALLVKMPYTAMIRNLATMTRVGLLVPLSEAVKTVTSRLLNSDGLKKARVHPIGILAALKTYAAGHGARGQHTWQPVGDVIDALDEAFYLSFGHVEPSHKRVCLALDVSSSMEGGQVMGIPGLTPRVVSAAMAMVHAHTEPQYVMCAFSTKMVSVNVTKRSRLDDVCRAFQRLPFGGTDCAQPMLWAMQQRLKVDAFVTFTDSETWAGVIHPSQALRQYRDSQGPAKAIVVGAVSNGFSIADPNDAGQLDVVGFSTDVPGIITDFIRGDTNADASR